MYGLADIRAMNNGVSIRNPQGSTDAELEQARKVHKRLLVWQAAYGTNTELSQLMTEAAELIDSAYGVSED